MGQQALIKVTWVNLPLSAPEPWVRYIDNQSRILGISRNAALCLIIKLGSPVLGEYVRLMKAELKRQMARITADAGQASENLGTPADCVACVMRAGYDRNKQSRGKH